MRATISRLLILSVLLVTLWCATGQAYAEQNGISLSPATLTLSLPPSATAQNATFDIANHYSSTITLVFTIEPRLGLPDETDPQISALFTSRW